MCAGYNFSNTCTSICVSKLKNKKTQEWWGRPVIPAAHEVQAGELQINSWATESIQGPSEQPNETRSQRKWIAEGIAHC